MKNPGLLRCVFVITLIAVVALSAEAGRFRRCRGECLSPEMAKAMRQTVARLTTRVVRLQEFIDSQKADKISAETKTEINRQIELIGVPTFVEFEPAIDENADLGEILTARSLATVGGEIAPIRRNLRRLQGLPPG